ncbi:hypothetical protein J6590_064724 [Homalodisca vitripennis]|nr:hypothetical protein J6590_064724 [Homalodisca vitripennis]
MKVAINSCGSVCGSRSLAIYRASARCLPVPLGKGSHTPPHPTLTYRKKTQFIGLAPITDELNYRSCSDNRENSLYRSCSDNRENSIIGLAPITEKTQFIGIAPITEKTQFIGLAPITEKTQFIGLAPITEKTHFIDLAPITEKTQLSVLLR